MICNNCFQRMDDCGEVGEYHTYKCPDCKARLLVPVENLKQTDFEHRRQTALRQQTIRR